MPGEEWLHLACERVANAVRGWGDLGTVSRIAYDRDSGRRMLAHIRSLGRASPLEEWYAFAAAIYVHRPFSVDGQEPVWVNFIASHRAMVMWAYDKDGNVCSEGECSDFHDCHSHPWCVARYFERIVVPNLRLKKASLIAKSPMADAEFMEIAAAWASIAVRYLETGRKYRTKPLRR